MLLGEGFRRARPCRTGWRSRTRQRQRLEVDPRNAQQHDAVRSQQSRGHRAFRHQDICYYTIPPFCLIIRTDDLRFHITYGALLVFEWRLHAATYLIHYNRAPPRVDQALQRRASVMTGNHAHTWHPRGQVYWQYDSCYHLVSHLPHRARSHSPRLLSPW
jgi:hypothetical protein